MSLADTAPGEPTAKPPLNGAIRREQKADEYRRHAEAATATAETSPAGPVREKHELSAATWTELARAAERPRRDTPDERS